MTKCPNGYTIGLGPKDPNAGKVFWTGKPGKCDGCGKALIKEKSFSDIKTFNGPWGLFCDNCVPAFSIGKTQHYGEGLGQRYERQDDGRFLKTLG